MLKSTILSMISVGTLLGLAALVRPATATPQFANISPMSAAEMFATCGDNLVDYEARSYRCTIVQYLGSSTSNCHYCYGDDERTVCCLCNPNQTGLCTDKEDVACDGVICFVGSVDIGPPTTCNEPPCRIIEPLGVCGSNNQVCPTYHKKGTCTP